jgi:hypothetical protein
MLTRYRYGTMLFLEKVRDADFCLSRTRSCHGDWHLFSWKLRLRHQPFADPSSQAALAETGVAMRARPGC